MPRTFSQTVLDSKMQPVLVIQRAVKSILFIYLCPAHMIKATLTKYIQFELCFPFDSDLRDDLTRIFICELDSIKMLPSPKLPDSFEQLSKTAPKLSKLCIQLLQERSKRNILPISSKDENMSKLPGIFCCCLFPISPISLEIS